MIKLRDYQLDAIDATYQWMRDNPGNPICVAPTGAGKAILIAKVCKDAWDNQRRVIVLAHVKELLQQEADKLQKMCPDLRFGVYSAGLDSRDTDNQILVGGIQSVYKKAELLGGFDLVIIDEAHRVSTRNEGMYRQFLDDLKQINPNTRLLGFTATPYRTGEGRIYGEGKLFDDVSYEIGITTLIQQGFLSPLVSKAGTEESLADYDALHIERGDFVTSEVEELAVDSQRLYMACQDLTAKTADRTSVLIFACSIAHANAVKEVITDLFHQECGLITGATPPEEREELQRKFQDKSLKYLVNVNVLTTGFDAPGIDSVVLLRPTASPVLYVQMVGRGFRIAPGKKNCLVLDYGGNVMRHGPVTAVNVRDGSPQRRSDSASSDGRPAMKTCPQCRAIIENWYLQCPYCEYEFPLHDTESSDDDILGGKATLTTYDVRDVSYRVWEKKSDPEAPYTVRVDYEIGVGEFVSEWICPEHSGYAFEKFCKWWSRRCELEPPETADECVSYAEHHLLAQPLKVTVRREPGKRYPTVKQVELGPIPEADEPPKAEEKFVELGLGAGQSDIKRFNDFAGFSDLEF